MPLIATLIANPAKPVLSGSLVRAAADASGVRDLDWLADGIACDLRLPAGAEPEHARSILETMLAEMPVDIVIHDPASRRKKILIADMDSTMIDQECIDELADAIGMKAEVAAITARAMRGEIAFEPALRERVALLRGLPVTAIGDVIENRITLASGARQLVATMKRHQAHAVLVSGGFTAFSARISSMIGFDEHRANRLVECNGTLTGEVEEPVLGREAKAIAVTETASRLGLGVADTIAVGDGANDLEMLNLAGTGVALHAKPVVAEAAKVRIDHGDLTALLFIQGYRQQEFALQD